MSLRYKMVIAYDGTRYSGYQTQVNALTVQDEIEGALQKLAKGEFVRIHAASRTDAGVHARGQVAHFDFPFEIESKGLQRGLNTLLPGDIAIQSLDRVGEDFHSRFDAKGKHYRYWLSNNPIMDPFNRLYACHHPYPLDLEAAQAALTHLVGRHDFTSFAASQTDVKDKVRTLYRADLEVRDHDWIFNFVGDGFLYNMVRIMVGTVVAAGEGKIDPDQVPDIIQAKDRSQAGKTMPSKGLCLMELYYGSVPVSGDKKMGKCPGKD